MRVVQDIANLGILQILVFGVMLTGIFYFTLFNDGKHLIKETDKIKTGITSTEAKIKEKEKELETTKDFVKQVEQGEEAVRYFLSYIPKDITTIDLFSFLNKEAKATGVNIEDKSDRDVLEVDVYEGLQAEIKITGSFSQTLLFLSNLTGQQQVIIVDEVNMSLKDSGTVSTGVKLMAFRYNEEKQKRLQEEKKQPKQGAK